MVDFEIPAPFLNLRINGYVNIVIASLCFIFQVCSIAMSPNNYYEIVGSGFWGAIIFGITAVVSKHASTGDKPFVLGCTFVLGIASMITSFVILCIFSSSLDTMHRYPDPCHDYVIIQPGDCERNNTIIPILPCGDYSAARQSFNAILLVCSLVGIPVNSLLILGVVSMYNPNNVSPN